MSKDKAATSLIDIRKDDLFATQQVIKESLGHKVAPSTASRWYLKGVNVAGQIIKLEGVRCGGKWLTTHEAFARFIQAQTEAANAAHALTNDEPTERPESTERRLQEAGLL
jgi:hypothetical protein